MCCGGGGGLDIPNESLADVIYGWSLAAAKDLHEQRLELGSEDAVDEDVDGGVDGDEQVGDLDDLVEPLERLDVDELLEDVADEGEDVAEEEDDHDDEEHHSQVVVLLLLVAQDRPRGVRPPEAFRHCTVFLLQKELQTIWFTRDGLEILISSHSMHQDRRTDKWTY